MADEERPIQRPEAAPPSDPEVSSPVVVMEQPPEQTGAPVTTVISSRQQFEAAMKPIQNYREMIRGLSADKIRQKVEPLVRAQVAEKWGEATPPEGWVQDKINQAILSELGEIQGSLDRLVSKVQNAGDSDEHEKAKRELQAKVVQLQSQGLLESDEAFVLTNGAQELPRGVYGADPWEEDTASPGGLIQMMRYRGVTLSYRSEETLEKIGNADQLADLLESEPYKNDDGTINFNKFYNEVQDVYEDILSIVDLKLGKFFGEAFENFYEGQAYTQLVRHFRNLAIELARRHPKLASKEVEITTLESFRNPLQTEAETRLMKSVSKKENVANAIGSLIVNKMEFLRTTTENIHDITSIVDQGLGWETFKKYNEKITAEHIDRLFHHDPELSEVINLYISSLKQTLILNKMIIPSDFGKGDDVTGLDSVQKMVLQKMLAQKGIGTGNNNEVTDKDFIEKLKMMRKIRLATGLAKGYTTEYWGILMNSSQGLSQETVWEWNEKKGRNEPKQKLVRTNASINQAGTEIMLADIDLTRTWDRFDLPGEARSMGWAYIPRHMDTKAGRKAAADYDPEEVYKKRMEYKAAQKAGAPPELLEFMENNLFLRDFFKFPVVDMLERGGWRAKQYQASVAEFADRNGRVVFGRAIYELSSIGPYALKSFFDDDEYISNNIHRFNLIGVTGDKVFDEVVKADWRAIRPDQKAELLKNFKAACYTKFIFGRLLDVTPTRVLAFEKRLYTPEGETLVLDDLLDFLKVQHGPLHKADPKVIKDKVIQLYVNGLQLVENMVLKKNIAEYDSPEFDKKKAIIDDVDELKAKIDAVKKLLDHKLEEKDLISDEAKELLGNFFQEFYKDNEKYLGSLKKADFVANMPKFFRELRMSIDKQRGRVSEGDKDKDPITLAQRFAKWQKEKFLSYEIGGEDLDFAKFPFQQAGARVGSRAVGEVFGVITSVVKDNMIAYIEQGLAEIAKVKWDDEAKLRQRVDEVLGKPLKDMMEAQRRIDYDLGNEFAIQMITFTSRILSEINSRSGLGLIATFRRLGRRNWTGKQGSILHDFFKWSPDRPTAALNFHMSEALNNELARVTNLPWSGTNLDTNGNPHKWHYGLVKEVQGHTLKNRLRKKWGPLAEIALAIIMFQLARAASKKNKEQQ